MPADMMHKWHKTLLRQFNAALNGKNPMVRPPRRWPPARTSRWQDLRSSLLVLSRVAAHFPRIKQHGVQLEGCLVSPASARPHRACR